MGKIVILYIKGGKFQKINTDVKFNLATKINGVAIFFNKIYEQNTDINFHK